MGEFRRSPAGDDLTAAGQGTPQAALGFPPLEPGGFATLFEGDQQPDCARHRGPCDQDHTRAGEPFAAALGHTR
jgi:hypothetical protein